MKPDKGIAVPAIAEEPTEPRLPGTPHRFR